MALKNQSRVIQASTSRQGWGEACMHDERNRAAGSDTGIDRTNHAGDESEVGQRIQAKETSELSPSQPSFTQHPIYQNLTVRL
jgi:hypothetical protein